MNKKKFKIIIVDDHKLFRDGLKFVVNQMENMEVIAEASTGVDFLNLLEDHEPDLVLMDISMPDLNGIEATKQATEKYDGINILAISMFSDEEYYYQMIQAGVKGFILKEFGSDELENAIHAVLKGDNYFSQKLLRNIIINLNSPGKGKQLPNAIDTSLTKREIEILKNICEGLSNAQIAEKLFISIRTVEGHKSNLISKTGVQNTISLVLYALRNNLVEI